MFATVFLSYHSEREGYLQAEHETLFQQLQKSPSVADTLVTEMERIQGDPQEINRTIWTCERDLHNTMIDIPDGLLKRALRARRRSSDWYLSEWLQNQCASVGGCCARGCGCCTKPRSSRHPNHLGHFVGVCKCCEEARGFKLDFEEGDENPMLVQFDYEEADIQERHSSYTKEALNAYIWGV